MFPKLLASIFLALGLFCLSVNDSLAESFFENITKKNVVLNLDKSCPLTASLANHNREKANAVPKLENIAFELRTPCKSERYTVAEAEKLIQNPAFNVDKITVALIAPHIDDEHVKQMADAYNCRDDYNFLAVDTSNYLKGEEYVSSAINVVEVGAIIAKGLHNLGIDSENIHLVGHGLGAHAAGSAGYHYAKQAGEHIARITGLDPARPCFKSGAIRSLQRSDASFVDIIHTNPGLLGLEDPLGHADYYPGGMELIKPGCDAHYICSHNRAVTYFIESVFPGQGKNFMATQCNGASEISQNTCSGTKSPMGIIAHKGDDGIFTLAVKESSPYGMDDNGQNNGKVCKVCEK